MTLVFLFNIALSPIKATSSANIINILLILGMALLTSLKKSLLVAPRDTTTALILLHLELSSIFKNLTNDTTSLEYRNQQKTTAIITYFCTFRDYFD